MGKGFHFSAFWNSRSKSSFVFLPNWKLWEHFREWFGLQNMLEKQVLWWYGVSYLGGKKCKVNSSSDWVYCKFSPARNIHVMYTHIFIFQTYKCIPTLHGPKEQIHSLIRSFGSPRSWPHICVGHYEKLGHNVFTYTWQKRNTDLTFSGKPQVQISKLFA